MFKVLKTYLSTPQDAAPLGVFRFFFGLLMLFSIIRFWNHGWIESYYLEPKLFFSYYGFSWVKPLGNYTYTLFILCGLSSLLVMLGYKYRIAIILFFLSFTYIELMDVTTYLNHYYLVSSLSFMMIFLPMNASFSVDAYFKRRNSPAKVATWNIVAIKCFISIVYFYAGLAKLNSDWIIEAVPLKIWLPSKYDTPIIGSFLTEIWAAYFFSWVGVLYDLSIPFLLWHKKTRVYAFTAVVIFHVVTAILFPIGMFPYIMIFSALIFFDAKMHRKIADYISRVLPFLKDSRGAGVQGSKKHNQPVFISNKFSVVILLFLGFQVIFPWRYITYPGELFWTEQGYRFSWRVMLMEKSGYAQFKVVEGDGVNTFYVDNTQFLTPFQEKQMAMQPDLILQYAHYLQDHYSTTSPNDIHVYVESYCALNGRLSTEFINPQVDLTTVKPGFHHKNWIIPFKDDIKGI